MKNGRNNKIKMLAIVFAFFGYGVTHARMLDVHNGNGNKGNGSTPTPTAGCSPASALAFLDFNNVRARLENTGGSMFQDRPNSVADYNIPKQKSESDPKLTAIYSGALWIAGIDQGLQLKVAAVTFRSNGSNDFWPGPLDNTPDVSPDVCSVFDQFFGVSKRMVKEHVAWLADPASFPNYQIPYAILNYPGKGNTIHKKSQSYYVADHLAPFYDSDPADDIYDPTKDYPFYDLRGDVDCRTSRFVPLFGDTTLWFVFNDMGNTHTESNSSLPIGMEIRGQAFAFATNDEVNDMTFYNYELVNRSSFTLTDTYFGQWVDTDLGNSTDDYVGCDASRGLGYCYNGDSNDEDASGVTGYGTVPPFIGVDFFEGPFMDNDGMDNPLTTDIPTAIAENGIPYSGLGIGYGDGIIDNERYGMRKFVYYSLSAAFPGDGDPSVASDFYNYLRGRWRDGSIMKWGGNGHFSDPDASPIDADLLFPGTSDPLHWSTRGDAPTPTVWSEVTENNTKGDRRFLESAGPFTLYPGAKNALTVGIVYARATSGDQLSSLTYLQVADDKAQALFDNCFKILDGPSAPDMVIQELENELILFLSNNNSISNNYNEGYVQKDPFIAIPDTLDGVWQGTDADKDTLKLYRFQGYQVYQVKNSNVSVSQLDDPNLSRLIAQVDMEDNVTRLVNYTYSPDINSNVPKEMVNGQNKGIRHSFRVTNDAFATGQVKHLVNHKTYHFIAVAYGHNNWKSVNPLNFTLGGQLTPYIGSRNNSTGGNIAPVSGIPHHPKPEAGGTILNAEYGDSPEITRIEGAGNGGLVLNLTSSSEAQIVSSSFMNYPVYEVGAGPIDVKVVDPLNVKKGTYYLQFLDSTTAPAGVNPLNDAYWRITSNGQEYYSERAITTRNEQIFTDLGFSVTIRQTVQPGTELDGENGYISASISYSDPSKKWFATTGAASDVDGRTDRNWILSGIQTYAETGPPVVSARYDDYMINSAYIDPNEKYESMLNSTWAPYRLLLSAIASGLATSTSNPGNSQLGTEVLNAPSILLGWLTTSGSSRYSATYYSEKTFDNLASVDIVYTSDKSKWSRCVVFETGNDPNMNIGGALYYQKRLSPNIDKNGIVYPVSDPNYLDPLGNPGKGMGWFPGYAINVETGERLNIAFGENSSDVTNNGTDLLWNPTSTYVDFTNFPIMDTVVGGRHYTYIFNSRYDEGKKLDSLLSFPRVTAEYTKSIKAAVHLIASTAIWAGIPIVDASSSLLATDARIKFRVQSPYSIFPTANSTNPAPSGNSERPMYMFSMDGFAAESGDATAAKEVLDMIKAVPNPYYAYSEYENTKLDTRIKITNLPEKCTISIYNVGGTLMRRYVKADPKTSLDWDLKNHVGIPVAGGVYLIHVEIPDVGETVLKWYGVTRPTDLNGF